MVGRDPPGFPAAAQKKDAIPIGRDGVWIGA
jgi:hypothetical protein